jgi:hypothetical protein
MAKGDEMKHAVTALPALTTAHGASDKPTGGLVGNHMELRTMGWALFMSLSLAGCASPNQPADPKPTAGLGETKATAIEVCKPMGQRAYLSRLVCADGTRPTFTRIGSFGSRTKEPENMSKEQSSAVLDAMLTGRALKPGEIDLHIVDGYEVACGAVKRTLYMDMYHCQSPPPEQAPAGFTLRGKS